MPYSSTTSLSDSDEYQDNDSETQSSDQVQEKKETRLFWSDGQVLGEKYERLQVPDFNAVESGYLADDESDTEEDTETRRKATRGSLTYSCSMSSSLFHSDSDGFEDRAVL